MKRILVASMCGLMLLLGCDLFSPTSPSSPQPIVPVNSADSLFTVLIARVQTLSDATSFEEASAVQFTDLRDDFNNIIGQDQANQKANAGYMVSAILALNSSATIKKMVDSLDAYFSALDSINSPTDYNSGSNTVLATTLAKQGVLGLAKTIGARTSEIMLSQTAKPSFPSFITMGYIQSIMESELLPVIDNVVAAAGRLEERTETSILIVSTDNGTSDTAKIDKAEIYLIDAYLRLLRAYGNWMCAYNYDIYAPGTTNYSWIDTLANSESSSYSTIYSLSADTLYACNKYRPDATELFMFRTLKYNMERTGFLTLRAANHAKVKQNLQAVPLLIKSALTSIRNEVGSQQYDLIKVSDILDIDQDMVNTPQELIDEGVSPALANKFRSPEALMDFITELLNGPYALDETIDSVHVSLTVDLTAYLDHPVNDLRTNLPKHRWLPEQEWISQGSESYRNLDSWSSRTIYTYDDNDVVNISAALIDSIVTNSYGGKVYYLKQSYQYRWSIDSTWNADPLRLINDASQDLDIDSLVEAKTFFPYFNDYTFDQVFPGMTRQKWLDMIYQ